MIKADTIGYRCNEDTNMIDQWASWYMLQSQFHTDGDIPTYFSAVTEGTAAHWRLDQTFEYEGTWK